MDCLCIYKGNSHCNLFASVTVTTTAWEEPSLSRVVNEVLHSERASGKTAGWALCFPSSEADAFLSLRCYLLRAEGRVGQLFYFHLMIAFPGIQV